MSRADDFTDRSLDSPEDLQDLSTGLSRADSLPDLDNADAQRLCKLQVSDADFHTEAKVCGDGRDEIDIKAKSRTLAANVLPVLRDHLKGPPPPSVAALPESIVGRGDGLPPPVMNIVIHVVGSRGDGQLFVSLGKVLRESYGHRIRLATHPTYKNIVEENGLEFFSIGGDPVELMMAFMVKIPRLMPGLDSIRSGDVASGGKACIRS